MEIKSIRYAFFNGGNYYLFKPFRDLHDIRTGKTQTALEFHKEIARERNRKDVFILDDKGQYISHKK